MRHREAQLSGYISKNTELTMNFDRTKVKEFLRSGALLQSTQDEFCLAWGPGVWSSSAPGGTPAFFIPDFFLEEAKPWWQSPNHLTICRDELITLLKTVAQPSEAWEWSEPEARDFSQIMGKIRKKMLRGHLEKAVPVVFARSPRVPDETQRAWALLHALEQPGKGWIYGWWDHRVGLMGLSPELLCYGEGRHWQSMALAGTKTRAEDFAGDLKEQREHELVVSDLVNQWQGLGQIRVSPTYPWDVGGLVHLRTDISLEADQDLGLEEMVRRLHPTPALGVSPREIDFRWLKTLSSGRGRFGAPFGIDFGDGQGFAVVGIRNWQWSEEGSLLGSGCGILRQSKEAQEWQELSLKRERVRRVFDL